MILPPFTNDRASYSAGKSCCAGLEADIHKVESQIRIYYCWHQRPAATYNLLRFTVLTPFK